MYSCFLGTSESRKKILDSLSELSKQRNIFSRRDVIYILQEFIQISAKDTEHIQLIGDICAPRMRFLMEDYGGKFLLNDLRKQGFEIK